MPGKKRSRKEAAAAPEGPVLDPSIFGNPDEQYGSSTAPSMVVQAEPTTRTERRLSKSKQRKLKKLAEEKIKRERRAGLYSSLAQHALKDKEAALIKGSGRLGQADTLRQRLKRDMQLQRMGMQVQGESQLVVEATPAAPAAETAVPEPALPEASPTPPPPPPATASAGFSIDLAAASAGKTSATAAPSAPPTVPLTEDEDVAAAVARLAALRAKNAALAARGAAATQDDARHGTGEGGGSDSPAQPSQAPATSVVKPGYVPGRDLVMDMASALARRSLAAQAAEIEAAGLHGSGRRRLSRAERKARAKATFAARRATVSVPRSAELSAARMELPVCGMEQEIMEGVYENDVLILCGETGSGKTTQVPQFLYEAGFGTAGGTPGMVAVTQPRRVAAVAMANRVATELCTKVGGSGHVGYQVRYDASHVSSHTRVKFLTDGILLREMQSDLLLRRYSVIILDEAHERNLNTDVLIVPLRNAMVSAGALPPDVPPLKLIIMSATLRVSDFTENKVLFPQPPPVVHVKARQFKVTPHFARRTELKEYTGEAFRKVCKIHDRLPPGGVLVFLTGQHEITSMVDRLRTHY
ncbi:ECM16, partial [Symbiodinium sp. KB8]